MARVLRVLALVFAIGLLQSGAAKAQDLEQLFDSTQKALNDLTNEGDPEEAAAFWAMNRSEADFYDLSESGDREAGRSTDDSSDLIDDPDLESERLSDSSDEEEDLVGGLVDQSGLNAANIISAGASLSDVYQGMTGTQYASNSIDGTFFDFEDGISQTGENIANVVQAGLVENVGQFLGESAMQTVDNYINLTGYVGFLSQTGRNTANVVKADLSINSGEQVFPKGARQVVNNEIDLRNDGLARRIEQSGVNIGNVLIADHVEDVSRTFSGEQVVNNTIYVNSVADLRPTEQTALNIANFVSASSVDNLTQVSDGQQVVNNKVYSQTLGEITAHHLVTRTSENYVNVLHLTGNDPKSSRARERSAGGSGTIRASAQQVARYDQTVRSVGTDVKVGKAAVREN